MTLEEIYIVCVHTSDYCHWYRKEGEIPKILWLSLELKVSKNQQRCLYWWQLSDKKCPFQFWLSSTGSEIKSSQQDTQCKKQNKKLQCIYQFSNLKLKQVFSKIKILSQLSCLQNFLLWFARSVCCDFSLASKFSSSWVLQAIPMTNEMYPKKVQKDKKKAASNKERYICLMWKYIFC